MIRTRFLATAATLALLGGVGVGLAATGPAYAGIAGSRATNANVNPVAGYITEGNSGPNLNLDHFEAYLGAQDKIGDLNLTLGNGFGGGLCQSEGGGTYAPAVEIGIIQRSPGVFQEAFGAGILGQLPGASTSADPCESGALGNFITTAPPASPPTGVCPNYGTVGDPSGVYAANLAADPKATSGILICTLGPTFSLGDVQESQVQYLPHNGALFSTRDITNDNPGVWYSSNGGTWTTDFETYLGGPISFNDGIIGVDADTTGLVGPASTVLAPWAHATLSSYTHHGHKDASAYFDTSSLWTAIPVSSYPNGNSGDAAVLAGSGLHNGNGQVLEGNPVG